MFNVAAVQNFVIKHISLVFKESTVFVSTDRIINKPKHSRSPTENVLLDFNDISSSVHSKLIPM